MNCVLLGDAKIGKSSIVSAYTGRGFTPNYEPTTREEYALEKELRDELERRHRIILSIVDTGGSEDLDRLRPLCYQEANVFLVCFSVVVPASFQSVTTKWIPEIKRHADLKKIAIALIGTQADLRSNTNILLKLSKNGDCPVSESRAIRIAGKIGAKHYIECSALSQKNIGKIFDYMMINIRKDSEQEGAAVDDGGRVNCQNQIGIHKVLYGDKPYVTGKKRRQLRQMLSKPLNVRKFYKMKRLMFFSCLFN